MADIHDSGLQGAVNEVNAGFAGPGALQNYVSAYVNFDNELATVAWPDMAKGDVGSLIADNQRVIGLMQPFVTDPTKIDLTALDKAKTAAQLAENQVRIDLGVPVP